MHTHQYLHVKIGVIISCGAISSSNMRRLNILTCTAETIALKSNVAGTLKAANGISASSVHIAVVNLQVTLIDIC